MSQLSGEVDIRYYYLKQTRFYGNFPLHRVVEDGCRTFLCDDGRHDSDSEGGDTAGGDNLLQRDSNSNSNDIDTNSSKSVIS